MSAQFEFGHVLAHEAAAPARISRRDLSLTVCLGVAGAVLSILATGFAFGAGDALFSLPLVGQLHQFASLADDSFIQALSVHAPMLWQLLQGSEQYMEPQALYLVLFICARVLSVTGLLLLGVEMGLRSRAARVWLAALWALAPLLQTPAFAVQGSLFPVLFSTGFSAASLAGSLTLFVWLALLRGRPGAALAVNGLVLACDPTMSAWNMVPILAVALALHRRGWFADRAARIELLGGLAVALVLAMPMLQSMILGGLTTGAEVSGVDYRAFLERHDPAGILPLSFSPRQWLALIAMALLALLALRQAARKAGALLLIASSYLAVCAFGALLPFVTDSRPWLNMQGLGAAGLVQVLAALGWSVLAVACLLSEDERDKGLWGPLLVLLGMTLPSAWLLLPIVLVLRGALRGRPWRFGPHPALTGIVFGACTFHALHAIDQHAAVLDRFDRSTADWQAVAKAVRTHSERQARSAWVLVPVSPEGRRLAVVEGAAVFVHDARRKVWVDERAGRLAIEEPAYQVPWTQRMEEVRALHGWDEKLAYAAGHGISYVVDGCEGLPSDLGEAGRSSLLVRTQTLCAAFIFRDTKVR